MTSSIVNSITTTPKKQKIRGVVRNAIEQDWISSNPVPDKGEIVYTSDTNTLKVGDGINKYIDLPTIAGGGGGGTNNYNELLNKPQINGNTLSGNKTSSDLGLATSAQGALADTALQPGDNISDLTNDSGFITGIDSSDVTSALGYTPVDPSDLSTVATTGNYNDLSNKPTIPAPQVNSDWNANSGVAQILNKPTIPTVPTNVSAFTNDAGYITGITGDDISTALGYYPVDPDDLSDVAFSGSYDDLLNKPTIPSLPKYLSVERLGDYLFKATFDSIPEYVELSNLPLSGACSSYVKDGKLYRNFDWKYDNTATFEVICKDFQGIGSIIGLNDGSLVADKIEQLPYHLVDGVNKHGIMVSTHVLYNDWGYAGAGNKDKDIMLLPYYILSNLTDITDINTVLGNYVANIKIPAALSAAEYLLHFVVTDGATTYCIMPPESATGSYVIQNITSNPKLTNFRWVSDATVVRENLQTRPTGVERWNEIETISGLDDLRFTKCYEAPTRLSEFIGIDHTTKDSTDAELTAIYNRAHAEYLVRERDGLLWQTVHSVVFGPNGIEHLWNQENWNKDYIISGGGSSAEDFDTLINRPSYNSVPMTHATNIPEVKTATWDAKQDAISDLSTIRSGAALGATAVQPGDNISELNNNAGYITGVTSSDITTALGYTPVNPSNLSTVATSGSYNDLSNKPTIPTVYNPTITFTQGGVTKGTITLNQSSPDTIAFDSGGSDLPSQTGNAGKFLTTNGTNPSWGIATVVNFREWGGNE